MLALVGGCASPGGDLVGRPVTTGPNPSSASTPPPGGGLRRPTDAQRVVVRWVTDGDTVTLRAVRRGALPLQVDTHVRLLEIDTPESKDPDLPVQCLALRATAATERLLPRGSTAWVQTDRELHDRYGRTLGYVWNAHGVFVNEALVRRGLARVLFFRPNDRHLARMRSAEAAARAAGRGLWTRCPSTP
ncbi:thermonuclease family protein [Nocardioides jiangxiensis]|uniref:Thermonuclease family protein n=1 Tax=Nocardioides jiangxiensis TaxID=3064524 RepID=A0ABT9AZZ7_9ACTN|nr:thermonuclease family protein [Nocardioides sp. WY-20]MDO7867614.1 thermonuclease family protein [Nocardioides sp. WY-20]